MKSLSPKWVDSYYFAYSLRYDILNIVKIPFWFLMPE
jgi:hypothetical protein